MQTLYLTQHLININHLYFQLDFTYWRSPLRILASPHPSSISAFCWRPVFSRIQVHHIFGDLPCGLDFVKNRGGRTGLEVVYRPLSYMPKPVRFLVCLMSTLFCSYARLFWLFRFWLDPADSHWRWFLDTVFQLLQLSAFFRCNGPCVGSIIYY